MERVKLFVIIAGLVIGLGLVGCQNDAEPQTENEQTTGAAAPAETPSCSSGCAMSRPDGTDTSATTCGMQTGCSKNGECKAVCCKDGVCKTVCCKDGERKACCCKDVECKAGCCTDGVCKMTEGKMAGCGTGGCKAQTPIETN